jgi:hypothetical protein
LVRALRLVSVLLAGLILGLRSGLVLVVVPALVVRLASVVVRVEDSAAASVARLAVPLPVELVAGLASGWPVARSAWVPEGAWLARPVAVLAAQPVAAWVARRG